MSKGTSKKIIIVLDYLELGGAERQAIHLAEYFKSNPKFDISVVGFRNKGDTYDILEKKGIVCHLLPLKISTGKKQIIKNSIKLLKFFWLKKPDAIFPYTYWSNLLCGLTWRFTHARICIWNQRDEGRNIRKDFLETIALKYVTHIISNSIEGREFLSSTFAISSDKIKIIHNGVTLNPPCISKEKWFQKLEVDEDTFIVTMIANLHAYKDHITLIKAWKTFADSIRVKNIRLLLAGRLDDMHYRLKALAFDLKLHDSIVFLGPVEDVSGLLNITDLKVLSSKNEGCPNGILEAMKSNKPVVATDILGVREALGENYEYLAEPDNENDLAKKISFFYQNKDIRLKVGKQNGNYVDKNFSIENMQKAYTHLLEVC